MTIPLRRVRVLALAVVAGAMWPSAATADDQIQADLQWGWVTLELGTAITLVTAAKHDAFKERWAVIGGLGTVTAAIGAGLVADRIGAPIAGANAVHGALLVGGELALIGALVDRARARRGTIPPGRRRAADRRRARPWSRPAPALPSRTAPLRPGRVACRNGGRRVQEWWPPGRARLRRPAEFSSPNDGLRGPAPG